MCYLIFNGSGKCTYKHTHSCLYHHSTTTPLIKLLFFVGKCKVFVGKFQR